jgi:hypothetical protein
MKPVLSISIPKYRINKKPNYSAIGEKLENIIKKNFFNKDIAVRCLSLRDHPKKSLEELIAIIEEKGTDRYDPKRKMSVAHDFYTEKGVELFASPVKVTDNLDFMADVLRDFYEGAVEDRGYSMKIDLIVVYDRKKLRLIPIQYEDGIGNEAFSFLRPKRKSEAVIGFIKIV